MNLVRALPLLLSAIPLSGCVVEPAPVVYHERYVSPPPVIVRERYAAPPPVIVVPPRHCTARQVWDPALRRYVNVESCR
jgi:hypothetical protein